MSSGLRIYDISNPRLPVEAGYFIPPEPQRRFGRMPEGKLVLQSEDVVVDRRGYIYVSDKNQSASPVTAKGFGDIGHYAVASESGR